MRHPLTEHYSNERATLLALGRELTEAQGAQMTDACPAWSIKDVYAHLAGISADILAGNVEGAATEPWADAQVSARLDRSLSETLDEWESAGAEVSAVMAAAGDAFPFQLFLDQWTHGWDIRAAIGDPAAAPADTTPWKHFLDDCLEIMADRSADDLPALTVTIDDRSAVVGAGPVVGELSLDVFEFARLTMGRRSVSQIDALPWPAAVADTTGYSQALVFWSVNNTDIVEPVLR